MPYIKLLEVGFDNITGLVGEHEFKEGVSVEELTSREADVLCSIMRAETVDGVNASTANKQTQSANLAAPVVAPLRRGDEVELKVDLADTKVTIETDVDTKVAETDVETKVAETEVTPKGEIVELAKSYTFDELAKVADEGGVAAIREIAVSREVKGRSINELIEGILKKQLTEAAIKDSEK
tara:strand:- start:42923 stop:43468 length:546 start_codon:yes stop_codon:yes gene_type:complete